MPKDEPKLCLECPLSPYWQAEVLRELREKQQRYHQVTSSFFGTVKLPHGVEEPSAYKICLARRVKLKELGDQCPYFPEAEDISRYASLQEEEVRAETVEVVEVVKEEPPQKRPVEEETVSPLRILTYKKPRRQTLIVEKRSIPSQPKQPLIIRKGQNYLESARKFYKTGLIRCPNCGSFKVSTQDPHWCFVCNYTFPDKLLAQ